MTIVSRLSSPGNHRSAVASLNSWSAVFFQLSDTPISAQSPPVKFSALQILEYIIF